MLCAAFFWDKKEPSFIVVEVFYTRMHTSLSNPEGLAEHPASLTLAPALDLGPSRVFCKFVLPMMRVSRCGSAVWSAVMDRARGFYAALGSRVASELEQGRNLW